MFQFRKTLRVLGVPAKSYEKQHGIIKTLNRGVLEHRIVEITYQSPGKSPKVRRIEPYTIALFQSSLYIIAAACEDENPESRIRSWKLDRFQKATILDEWFKEPEDLDLDQFVGNTMRMFVRKTKQSNYKIKIAKNAAAWVIEDPLHAEQEIKQLKDGSIVLTVSAVHEMEIIPRVLSMGANAEIVSPKAARKLMGEIVKQMAGKYDD